MSSHLNQSDAIITGVVLGVIVGTPILCVTIHYCSKAGQLIMKKMDSIFQKQPTDEASINEFYDIETGDIPDTINPSRE